MLRFIGVGSIEDLIADIPEEVRMKEPMELPEPFEDEAGIYRHERDHEQKYNGGGASLFPWGRLP